MHACLRLQCLDGDDHHGVQPSAHQNKCLSGKLCYTSAPCTLGLLATCSCAQVDRDPKAVLSLGETFSFDKACNGCAARYFAARDSHAHVQVRATFALFKEAFAGKEGGVVDATPHSNTMPGPSSAALSASASGSGALGRGNAHLSSSSHAWNCCSGRGGADSAEVARCVGPLW